MIEEYLNQVKNKNNSSTYQEGIYKQPLSNIIEYNKEEVEEDIRFIKDESNNIQDTSNVNTVSEQKEEQTQVIKSQILNTNH